MHAQKNTKASHHPMKYNLRTTAIVELASFTPLEEYQIDFLLRIGSFLSAAILNIQTPINVKLFPQSRQLKKFRLRLPEIAF
jgi:hypothetical protein